jgi:cell shape-determining protein MreD
MRRALVILATLVLLWIVLTELNHALAPWHVYFWIGGLFVTYSALTLTLRSGLFASLCAGMILDASASNPFGTHALLFAAAHVIIFNVRDRVPRDETVARVVIALLANLALFLVLSFFLIARLPVPAAAWPRLIVDLVCSQLLIALIGPWFFALQTGALEISRPFTTRYGREVE